MQSCGAHPSHESAKYSNLSRKALAVETLTSRPVMHVVNHLLLRKSKCDTASKTVSCGRGCSDGVDSAAPTADELGDASPSSRCYQTMLRNNFSKENDRPFIRESKEQGWIEWRAPARHTPF